MKIVIIGSGPSLLESDIALIQQSGLYTITTNSVWKLAPFCNAIFAGDGSWWRENAAGITIDAERWCCIDQVQLFGTQCFKGMSGWNSGANAIWFALKEKQASEIIITGFDCSLRHGTHAHGDHPKTQNPRPDDVARWHAQFKRVAELAKAAGVPLWNCSRYTEITSIPRVPLPEVLNAGQNRLPNHRTP